MLSYLSESNRFAVLSWREGQREFEVHGRRKYLACVLLYPLWSTCRRHSPSREGAGRTIARRDLPSKPIFPMYIEKLAIQDSPRSSLLAPRSERERGRKSPNIVAGSPLSRRRELRLVQLETRLLGLSPHTLLPPLLFLSLSRSLSFFLSFFLSSSLVPRILPTSKYTQHAATIG